MHELVVVTMQMTLKIESYHLRPIRQHLVFNQWLRSSNTSLLTHINHLWNPNTCLSFFTVGPVADRAFTLYASLSILPRPAPLSFVFLTSLVLARGTLVCHRYQYLSQ
jgi:hypothetical protein